MTTARSIGPSTSAAPRGLSALLAQPGPLVMGVLNITPDSFSDGGRYLDAGAALAQAKKMIAEGAAIIDVGAESTRPYSGMQPISATEELARLEPILADVVALGTPVSIDTMKAEVARAALRQGVTMLNDVWGLQRDAEMAAVAADHDVPVVLMHNREAADPAIDVMEDIAAFFERALVIAAAAGIRKTNIILDPGIGFGKTARQNIEAIARLGELADYDLPIMIGVSRKALFGSLIPAEIQRGTESTPIGTVAVSLAAAAAGASIFRVHDVADHVAALAVFDALRNRAYVT